MSCVAERTIQCGLFDTTALWKNWFFFVCVVIQIVNRFLLQTYLICFQDLLNHKLSETLFTKLFQELNHSMNRELNDVTVTHFVLKTGAKSKKYVFWLMWTTLTLLTLNVFVRMQFVESLIIVQHPHCYKSDQ